MLHLQGELRCVNLVLVIHLKLLKVYKGWFSMTRLVIHFIWGNMMMRHTHEGLMYEKLEKNQPKPSLSKKVDALL